MIIYTIIIIADENVASITFTVSLVRANVVGATTKTAPHSHIYI